MRPKYRERKPLLKGAHVLQRQVQSAGFPPSAYPESDVRHENTGMSERKGLLVRASGVRC
jgi:hypothetical protein